MRYLCELYGADANNRGLPRLTTQEAAEYECVTLAVRKVTITQLVV